MRSKLFVLLTALLLALPLAALQVSAHHDYDERFDRGPIYATGYHYYPYVYGWSGWDYHRVNYRYHYPSISYRYGGYYPGYHNNVGWARYYAYEIYPAYPSFPSYGWYGRYYW